MQKLQRLNFLLGEKLVLVQGWFAQEMGLGLERKMRTILGEYQDNFGNRLQWKKWGRGGSRDGF